ncbi:MAG TPA: 4Fe-4S binding protein [Candidatus Brocadiia bacterium]|nr:4Fe-4S binding protein [Planctomycetota bacterium]MDO8094523.1 4Fe-4S binding protein [Candidatus Brocadiales bacterium]
MTKTKTHPTINKAELPTWCELSGAVISAPGSSTCIETGTWRTYMPIRDAEKCIQCMRCWIYCPDSAIIVEDGKVVGIDYEHCKGCGICAKECTPKDKAIVMKEEIK